MATTNDNLPALYFYQRQGYRLVELAPDSIVAHTHQEHAGFAQNADGPQKLGVIAETAAQATGALVGGILGDAVR